MEEIWKDVIDYEGYYEVSNLGRVRSVDRVIFDNVRKCDRLLKGRILKKRCHTGGYNTVSFCKEHIVVNKFVHRLVAEAFISNPDNLPMVNHKDEDKTNNCIYNLEWCDVKYNNEYGTRKERWYNTRIKNGTIDISHIGSKIKKS